MMQLKHTCIAVQSCWNKVTSVALLICLCSFADCFISCTTIALVIAFLLAVSSETHSTQAAGKQHQYQSLAAAIGSGFSLAETGGCFSRVEWPASCFSTVRGGWRRFARATLLNCFFSSHIAEQEAAHLHHMRSPLSLLQPLWDGSDIDLPLLLGGRSR